MNSLQLLLSPRSKKPLDNHLPDLRSRRLLSCVLPLLLCTLPVAAVEAQYTCVTNNGTLTIEQYSGPGGTVIVPAIITGLPVDAIGDQAFAFTTSITNITIPDSVQSLGSGAFLDCASLTSVQVGAGLKNIGNQAFMNCSVLTNIAIPSGVTNIGQEAFYGCTALPAISIPSTVTNIGPGAFSWCVTLTSMTIPANVASLGQFVFDSCGNLTAITVDPLNPSYSSQAGVLFDKAQTTLLQCPGAKTGTYAVPNGVTTIAPSAFRNCNGVTSISIPNSVTNIGNSAFDSCASLTSISVNQLNSRYSSLAGALFDKSQSTLIQCPAGLVGTYVVPATVTNIVATAFVGCAGLTAINASTNSSSYSSSGGVLFDKAKSTVIQYPAGASGSYTIPSTVTHLGSYAFAFSPLLTGINIPATVQSIGLAAFAGCTGLTNLSIPDSVVSISDEAFEACESLSQLSFGKGLTNIGLYAFFECTSLTNIVLPDGLTTLGDRAFESCSSVQTVTLGKNLSSIGSFTFGFCGNLTNVFAKGNAPSVGSATFPSGATVYRLYGTKGWSSTLSGVPTALWNPLIQTAALRPSLATNGFAFSYSGPTNLAVIVEFSSDLSKSKWTPVQTNILSGGAASFKALRLTNAPVGFYRIRCP